jgi:hypothetical protein
MQATESHPVPDGVPRGRIPFACQSCGKNITFPGERGGHVEICPYCNEYVDVPDRPAVEDPPVLAIG